MAAFRRYRRRSGRQEDFGPRARRAMQRANSLMENGDHANAAVLLDEVANTALGRGRARPAAFLLLQAARAHLLSGETARGAEQIRSALDTLAGAGAWPALRRFGPRLVSELEALGQAQLAAETRQWLEKTLPVQGHEDQPSRAVELRGSGLPLKCPSCGATVRPDEVEWLEGGQAALCAYCASVLPARQA